MGDWGDAQRTWWWACGTAKLCLGMGIGLGRAWFQWLDRVLVVQSCGGGSSAALGPAQDRRLQLDSLALARPPPSLTAWGVIHSSWASRFTTWRRGRINPDQPGHGSQRAAPASATAANSCSRASPRPPPSPKAVKPKSAPSCGRATSPRSAPATASHRRVGSLKERAAWTNLMTAIGPWTAGGRSFTRGTTN